MIPEALMSIDGTFATPKRSKCLVEHKFDSRLVPKFPLLVDVLLMCTWFLSTFLLQLCMLNGGVG